MHVLILSRSYLPLSGPRPYQVHSLCLALESAGCKVSLIAGLPFGTQQPTGNGIQPIYLRYRRTSALKIPLADSAVRLYGDYLCARGVSKWAQAATSAAEKVIEREAPDLILTVSFPIDAHIAGLALKKKTNHPWVVYISDPWPPGILPHPYSKQRLWLIERRQKHLMRSVLEKCDRIILPSKYSIECLNAGLSIDISRKSEVIPHIGMASAEPESRAKRRDCLLHVGDLGSERSSVAVLQGIKIAVDDLGGAFRGLKCIGPVNEKFRKQALHHGLQQVVTFSSTVSRSDAVGAMKSAAGLLMIEADMPYSPFLPSKAADYVASGTPVIAVTPERSELRDFLKEHGGGIAVGHNPQEISRAIKRLLTGEVAPASPEGQAMFASKCVVARYLGCFKRAIDQKA